MDKLQKAVCDIYALHDRTADAIVCDPELAAWFATQVNTHLKPDAGYGVREIMHCLLNMRKAGKLSRKFRSESD